jgi:multiple sugar transport system substrate-binding protein
MRRRTAAVLAVAALALTACSSTPDAGTSPSSGAPSASYDSTAPVTITVWHGQTADAAKVMSDLATKFHTLHPNITVVVQPGASSTDELKQKIAAGFVADTYPDVSYVYGSWAGELAQSGKVLDATAWVKDPAVDWEGMPAASRATATVDGKVFAIPAIVGNLAVIYNKTLFDKAGLAYPSPDGTWDDFRADAKKLTVPAVKQYGTAYSVAGNEDTTWHLWPQLWQNGGQILSADQQSAAFNSDAGVKALEYWRTLAVDDASVYLDQTGEKYGPLFLDGRIGMQISGPWNLYDVQQRKTNYGVVQLPGTNGDHQTISGTDLWALFDHGDAARAHAAFEFSTWLTQPEQDAVWNIGLGNLPLRTAETSTPAYAQFVTDYPGGAAFVANLANAKQPRPTVAGYDQMSQALGAEVAKVLQGQESSKDALDKAAAAAADALAN